MYSINFNLTKKKFCLSLYYNGANSYLFVNGTEMCKFKAKNSNIIVGQICLGNISKDWSVNNMKKTGFTGYIYDFSGDYNAIDVDNIKDIHKYLMKKNNSFFHRINNFIRFYKREFFECNSIELYFNEKSRV